jgi:hypothetical protein
MNDLRAVANDAAQAAFRALIERYAETGEWDRTLTAEFQEAEALYDFAVARVAS